MRTKMTKTHATDAEKIAPARPTNPIGMASAHHNIRQAFIRGPYRFEKRR